MASEELWDPCQKISIVRCVIELGIGMPFMHWISTEPECGLISTPEYGTHGLTCYHPGTTNLIISVPHGGEMRPPFIADRQRPASGKLSTRSEGNKLTSEGNKLTKEGNTFTEEGSNLAKEERKLTRKEENTHTKAGSKSTKEGVKLTRDENKSAKEGSRFTKKGSKLIREGSDPDEDTAGWTEENKLTKEGSMLTKEGIKLAKKGDKLTREGSWDPDEDTAGRITTAADIYTQVGNYPPVLIENIEHND